MVLVLTSQDHLTPPREGREGRGSGRQGHYGWSSLASYVAVGLRAGFCFATSVPVSLQSYQDCCVLRPGPPSESTLPCPASLEANPKVAGGDSTSHQNLASGRRIPTSG